jgi:hypothetical protein
MLVSHLVRLVKLLPYRCATFDKLQEGRRHLVQADIGLHSSLGHAAHLPDKITKR